VVLDPAPEKVDGAACLKLLRVTGHESLPDVVAMAGDEPLPLLGLAVLEKGEEVVGVEGEIAVPALGIAGDPAAPREVIDDEILEGLLEVNAHVQAAPGMGIWPVTAAVINACRLSIKRRTWAAILYRARAS
jgi:hypothetical protein